MAADSTPSVMNILDLPRKCSALVIGNLNLKDRESFALACGGFNLIEKTVPLCFPIVCFTKNIDGCTYKIRNKDGSDLCKTESFEKAIEFKERRIISSIGIMQLGIYNLQSFEESLPIWRGIKIEKLFIDISFWFFEREDPSQIIDVLHQCVRSGDIDKIRIATAGAEPDIPKEFFTFIEELPPVPLEIVIFDETINAPSCALVRYAFIEKMLAVHQEVYIQLLCPKVSGKQYRQLYEGLAKSGDGFKLKVLMDFEKLVAFLDELDVELTKEDEDLCFSVLEESPAAKAEIFVYNFSSKIRAYFCYFPNTRVLLKLQSIQRTDRVEEYSVQMNKISSRSGHWAWANKTKRIVIEPDTYIMQSYFDEVVEKIASIF